ncbi:MAG TPA: HAD hydrolase family protein [Pyrinomonadaceae bacterium]|nr:HAD hydrolase family protein [Pyrinomonadaceae bacterium]
MAINDSEVQSRAARIKLFLMDCDGVLTDGRIWILDQNDDQKGFYSRDGLGIELLHRAGLRSGVISGRVSSALARRAHWLGMTYVRQGFPDKEQAFAEVVAEAGLTNAEVAFAGDDLNDIPLLLQSGLGIAVADAALETRAHAHYVTQARGGQGAVREVIELILKAQGRWDQVLRHYLR